MLRKLRKISMQDPQLPRLDESLEIRFSLMDRIAILIHDDSFKIVTEHGAHRSEMPAASEGAVEITHGFSSLQRGKILQYFPDHHRRVGLGELDFRQDLVNRHGSLEKAGCDLSLNQIF